jgi:hypothetical protein
MICAKCKKDKDKDDFPSRGLACKDCVNIYYRAYYAKNKTRMLELTKKRQPEITRKKAIWRDENREHIREYMRLYMLEYKRGFRRREHSDESLRINPHKIK